MRWTSGSVQASRNARQPATSASHGPRARAAARSIRSPMSRWSASWTALKRPSFPPNRRPSARDFYAAHFGFTATYESDWYVSLRHVDAPHHELAFVRYDHPTVPEGGRAAAQGVILNFEVADATAAWERLRGAGAPVLLALRDAPFGQRHFVFEGPGRVMIDVIENIAPAPEFAGGYAQA